MQLFRLHLFLKIIWAEVSQIGVAPLAVVKHLYIINDISLCFFAGEIRRAQYSFSLHPYLVIDYAIQRRHNCSTPMQTWWVSRKDPDKQKSKQPSDTVNCRSWRLSVIMIRLWRWWGENLLSPNWNNTRCSKPPRQGPVPPTSTFAGPILGTGPWRRYRWWIDLTLTDFMTENRSS